MRIRNRSRLGLLYLKEKDSADNFQGNKENSILSSSSSPPLQEEEEEEESMPGAEEDVDDEEFHHQEAYYLPQLFLLSSLEDGEIRKSSPQEAAVFLGESMGQNTTTTSNITVAKKHKGRTLEEEDDKKQNTIIQEKVNHGTNKKRKEKERADEPEMPKLLKDVIVDDQVQGFGRCVNTKHIYESNFNDNQNRLYLPSKQIEEVLTEEEKELTRTPDNRGIAVHVFYSKLCVSKMNIKWWTCKRYVLNKQWKTFATANNIEEGDTAEIWSFRNQFDMLYLAINFRKGETKKKKDQDPKGGAIAIASCRFIHAGSEEEKALHSNSGRSRKRPRTLSPGSPAKEEKPEKRKITGLIAQGSLCSFNVVSKIGMRATYLLVKPAESEDAEVINIHDLTVSSFHDTRLRGCVFLASKLNGWVLMIRPDNRTILYFNLIRRTVIDHLPPLPDATEECLGTFDSIPTRFDNKTVILAITTQNGANVVKFFINKDRSDHWTVHFIENQNRLRIDSPLLYRNKLIWISNGNCVEVINEDGQFRQLEIAGLDVGYTSMFTRNSSLYIVKCMVVNELPAIVKVDLEPNAFAINQYEIVTSIAPFDIFVIPRKEASYVYNPREAEEGNCLFYSSDFDHHLCTYVIAGGAIVEGAREFLCENCPCEAAFYGV